MSRYQNTCKNYHHLVHILQVYKKIKGEISRRIKKCVKKRQKFIGGVEEAFVFHLRLPNSVPNGSGFL